LVLITLADYLDFLKIPSAMRIILMKKITHSIADILSIAKFLDAVNMIKRQDKINKIKTMPMDNSIEIFLKMILLLLNLYFKKKNKDMLAVIKISIKSGTPKNTSAKFSGPDVDAIIKNKPRNTSDIRNRKKPVFLSACFLFTSLLISFCNSII